MKFHTVSGPTTANGVKYQIAVAELKVRKIFISSANKKYLECLIELQSSLINTLNHREPRTYHLRTIESSLKCLNKSYGFGQQNKDWLSNCATN